MRIMKRILIMLSLNIWAVLSYGQVTISTSEYIRRGPLADSVYYEGKLFTGTAIKKAENGQIIAEEHYENGIANGIWREWYPTGKQKFTGKFNDGKNDGEWIQWYEDGSIQRKVLFKNGKMIME